jgi:hypothetical protein
MTCAPSRRPLHTTSFEKMLVDTQSSNCAFLFAVGAHWPVIQHAESRGVALTNSAQFHKPIYLFFQLCRL